MELSKLMVDGSAALDGAWVGDLDGMGDAQFLIRSLDCPAAQKKTAQLYKAIYGKRQPDVIDPEIRDYVLARALVEDCLIDWRSINDGGKPKAFDRDWLKSLMFIDLPADFNRATPDLKFFNEDAKLIFEALLEASTRNRAKARDDDAEKSRKKPSRTSSAG